jgi:flavin-dependent dehydrogenase
MVIRPAFDQYLIQRATAAGAQLRTDCRMTSVEQTADGVTVHTETEAFNARVLVGADGVNSTVAAAVDLLPNRTTGVALEAELSVPSDVMQRRGRSATFDFGALPRGYGWIFPKREQLSVGVFRASKDHAPRLKQRLERFLDRQPDLSAREVVHLQGHRIPLGGDHATLHASC